jgi:N-methylhydantoinase A/oxoprolinase/acetone carboxylase beta subunit
LRVPFGAGAIDGTAVAAAIARFHAQHRAEYGHAFPDSPVEIVNLRVTGIGPRPKLAAPEPRRSGGGDLAAAMLRRGPVMFAGPDGEPVWCETPFLARDRLPTGVPVPGPAVVLQPDSTTVLPPGSSLVAEAGGNLRIAV